MNKDLKVQDIEHMINKTKRQQKDSLFNSVISIVPLGGGIAGFYPLIDTITNTDIHPDFPGLMFCTNAAIVITGIGGAMLIVSLSDFIEKTAQKQQLLKLRKKLVDGYNIKTEEKQLVKKLSPDV